MRGTVGLLQADRRWRMRRTCKRSGKASLQREKLYALLSGTGEGDATRRELKEKRAWAQIQRKWRSQIEEHR